MRVLGWSWVAGALLCAACEEPNEAPIEPPEALSDSVPFAYPIELWDHNISGQTVLLLRISELGVVDSVAIATPSGYWEFDSAAVQGARALRFAPGRQGERRVAMWTRLPVRFARDTTPRMGLGVDEEENEE
jgi:TonB family protein